MEKRTRPRYGVVWDFDDVIFDTARFKRRIAAALAREGYARSEVLRTVAIAKDKNGYSPAIHGRLLASGVPDAKRIEALIWRLLRAEGRRFLWPDAKRLLGILHARHVPMYLLSAGNPAFQKTKIENCGLKRCFKKVEYVPITALDSAGKTKVRVVKKFLKDHSLTLRLAPSTWLRINQGKLLFLDDRPKNIAAIARELSFKGRVTPVLIRRPQTKLTLALLRKAAPEAGF